MSLIKNKKSHEDYLIQALKEAEKASRKGEVPIGAVIVFENKIIARAHNLRESSQLSTAHAEKIAIEKACRKLESWRLINCDLYVTLEPCPMCAGAIYLSRIRNVFFGAKDAKGGIQSLEINIANHPKLNHQFNLEYIHSPQCSQILSSFFKNLRKQKAKF